jgi:hypothetical protein
MLDLNPSTWRTLQVPTGDASRIPSFIRAFWIEPSGDTFDNFFDELTGIGDLAILDSFYAALPHAVQMAQRLEGDDFEAAVAQLGWGIAIAGDSVPPPEFAEDFQAAVRQVATMARSRLRAKSTLHHREWMVAAVAAGRGKHELALRIIDQIG